mgnify:CR=1 FL=1
MIEGSPETTRIERDLEETRARLDATIGALQQKLSPGQLLDQSLAYLKDSGGGEFAHNLKSNVQTHPMPVALIGIGLAWLMMGGNAGQAAGAAEPSGRPRGWDRHDGSEALSRAEAAAASVRRTASETAEAFQERLYLAKGKALGVSRDVGEALSDFGGRVDAAMQAAQRSARDTARGVREAAGSAMDAAGSAIGSTREATGRAADAARDAAGRAAGYLQEQPLLMGAIGVSVGALLGALLPPTRTEDQLLGGISEKIKDRAYEAADTAISGGVRVADAAMQAGSETADREGLTSDSADETMRRAGSKVAEAATGARHVVEDALTAGREAVERELEGSDDASAAPRGGSARAG